MPLYEYECDACGHRFEVIQKMSDPPIDRCPKCGASVHKLQSAPAFQFKGTGWYVTDYAKKAPTEGQAKGESDAKKDGKTEAKGEAKSEGKSEAAESSSKSAKTDAAPKPSSGDSASSTSKN